jgi:hypothetical protein
MVLSGGGGSDGTTVPPTTNVLATTIVPPTTMGEPPRHPSTTVEGRPVDTVVVEPAAGALPSLANAGGTSLYIAAGRAVARIELDTGRTTVASRMFPVGDVMVQEAVAGGGRLIVTRDSGVFVIDAELAGSARSIEGTVGRDVDVAVDASAVLTIEYAEISAQLSSSDDATTVQRVMVDGTVAAEWRVPTFSPLGLLGDDLVVQGGGRIYKIGAEVRPYAQGELVVADGRWVLWRSCDDTLSCVLHLGDGEHPDRRTLPAELISVLPPFMGPGFMGNPFVGRFLIAPDGATMVIDGGAGRPPLLVDVASGAVISEIDGDTRPAWSTDGAWLFTTSGRSLLAVSTRGEPPFEIPLPEGDFGNRDLVLAVG